MKTNEVIYSAPNMTEQGKAKVEEMKKEKLGENYIPPNSMVNTTTSMTSVSKASDLKEDDIKRSFLK